MKPGERLAEQLTKEADRLQPTLPVPAHELRSAASDVLRAQRLLDYSKRNRP